MIVPITGTVAQIEQAFNVRMNNYKHPSENRNFFSSDHEPSLNLNVPVARIAGLNNYSLPPPRSRAQGGTTSHPWRAGTGFSRSAQPSNRKRASAGSRKRATCLPLASGDCVVSPVSSG
jgi:hypothetical protein